MITYPLTFPTAKAPRRVDFSMLDVVGRQASPISLDETTYDWGGDGWEMDVEMPPMLAAIAEQYVAWLAALRGPLGSFLMGPAAYKSGARGTWNGAAPQVNGAHVAGVRILNVKNVGAAKTVKAGDWLQLSSGSTPRLHKVLQDAAIDGGGLAALDIYPKTRAALANGDAIVIAAPQGRWALVDPRRTWSIEEAQIYGIKFSCREARDF